MGLARAIRGAASGSASTAAQRLTISEYGRVRRWWRSFLADEKNWQFTPRLVHLDLGHEHLLVDEGATTLLSALDFGDAAIGDPAIDFVCLVRSCGAEFAWRVMEAYRNMGGAVDGDFFLRVRRLGAVAPFHAVQFAAEVGDPAALSLKAAIEEVRRGPVLGLD